MTAMGNERSFQNSELGGLSQGDREAFARLGILHEEAVIQPATAAVLWSLTEIEAGKRLQRLQGAELVQPIDDEGYRLDNTTHEGAKQILAERMPLPEAHAHLLEGYRAQTQGGLWHTLPDDGYIYRHLTWHMAQAGWEGEIHALLREETPEGQNGWYKTRLRQGQPADYQQDVTRARRLAEERRDVGLQCRYALIAASTSSAHDDKLPLLLGRLVETGIWPPERGLAYARQFADEARRGRALAQLAPSLPESLYGELLSAARGIGDEEARVQALAGLARFFPARPEEPWGKELLAIAEEIEDEESRAAVLINLAPRLAKAQPAQLPVGALDIARAIESAGDRGQVLAALAPHLPEPLRMHIMQEALVAMRQARSSTTQARILLSLAPHLPESLKAQALQDTITLDRGFEFRAWATHFEIDYPSLVSDLAEHLPESQLREALAHARRLRNTGDRAEALAGLAPHLPERLRKRALKDALSAARKMGDYDSRLLVLAEVSARLPELQRLPVLEKGLVEARQIENEHHRALELAKLGLQLPDPHRAPVQGEGSGCCQGDKGGEWACRGFDRGGSLPIRAAAESDTGTSAGHSTRDRRLRGAC
ncbi:MAG: hypothetical protein P8129_25695 [Anaerolineae bacterium]